jgi:hypothetical protein
MPRHATTKRRIRENFPTPSSSDEHLIELALALAAMFTGGAALVGAFLVLSVP